RIVVLAELEREVDLVPLLLADTHAFVDEPLRQLALARRHADRTTAGHVDLQVADGAGALANAGVLTGLELGDRRPGSCENESRNRRELVHVDPPHRRFSNADATRNSATSVARSAHGSIG